MKRGKGYHGPAPDWSISRRRAGAVTSELACVGSRMLGLHPWCLSIPGSLPWKLLSFKVLARECCYPLVLMARGTSSTGLKGDPGSTVPLLPGAVRCKDALLRKKVGGICLSQWLKNGF